MKVLFSCIFLKKNKSYKLVLDFDKSKKMIAVTSRPIPKRIINECVASKLIAGNTEPCEPCLQQPRGWVSRAGGAQSLSHVQLFVTPWTIACQAPLSMGFSRQGYWSGLPCPSPGDFSNPGIEPTSPVSPALQADSLSSESLGKPSSGKTKR